MTPSRPRPWLASLILVVLSVAAPLAAQSASSPSAPADASRLTLERIFRAREFSPESFGPARWMPDGDSYATVEAAKGVEGACEIVLYKAATGERTVLVPASKLVPAGSDKPLALEDYSLSRDGRRLLVFTNSKRVWRQNTRGDFWVLDIASGRLRKLGPGFPESTLQFAKLSPDGRTAAYVHANDLYAEGVEDGRIVRLTFDGSDTIVNGTGDWVNEEEFGIRDGFRWSPDGAAVAFWRFDTSGVPVFTMINNTDATYPSVVAFRHPKAGQTNSAVGVGVVPAGGGRVVRLDLPGNPRDSYVASLDWGPSGEVMVQRLNRLQNTNDYLAGDPRTGAVRTLFTDTDAAWVEPMDAIPWIDQGRSFLWLSERDGWRHVYRVSRRDGAAVLLTPGEYDVVGLDTVDERGGWFTFIASPDDPTRRALYRRRLDGRGRLERVSPAGDDGVHAYQTSPNGAWAIHTRSSLDRPPVVDLVALSSHKTVRTLAGGAALAAKVDALARTPAEFFTVAAADGVALDGWMIKPPAFDPSKKYPLLVYVYGEPAGQTTVSSWGGGTYLWHLYLAQQGYVVASLDNRGTPAPRGRAWRKSIYKQIGVLASADQAAGVRALLKDRPWLDPQRVGVWGWSGGGSMTLNAMFRYPDLYKAGISVASVPDERLYDSIYQERYMSLPSLNADGYAKGSPVSLAKDLAGDLLIVHGTGDDNVHYQGFELLVNELIRREKIFSMMSYPNRSHGISEGEGTTMHLYRTMEAFLRGHLPPGPR